MFRLFHRVVTRKLFFKSIRSNSFLNLNRASLIDNRVLLINRRFSTESVIKQSTDDNHCIISDTETILSQSETHQFQAETGKLLEIVAKSLYSDKEVFIRELISNASDALEKFRYLSSTGGLLSHLKREAGDKSDDNDRMEIHIKTDTTRNRLIIQDTGIGMTRQEMVDNLGTIARSGSRAFLSQSSTENDKSIIGQFGVGFYSSFIVSERVEVASLSRSGDKGANKRCHLWRATLSGDNISNKSIEYEIGSIEGGDRLLGEGGTRIELWLRPDCKEWANEAVVERAVARFSRMCRWPVFVNGKRQRPLQMGEESTEKEGIIGDEEEARKQKDKEMAELYRDISSDPLDKNELTGTPRFTMKFRLEAPIDIKAVLFVPNRKPSLYEISRESGSSSGVSLYSRKVLIMNRAEKLLPSWLRFLRGIVESDDIPLNLSRELLQDSALVAKINRVLTARVIKYLSEQSQRERDRYIEFYRDFGLYLKEGIINTVDQTDKENIAKLLRFESNKLPPGQYTSFAEYSERMKAGSRKIYFFSAPNRHIAENSPYIEAINKKDIEVLYLFEPYDEIVVMQLGRFDNKELCSVETEHSQDASNVSTVDSSNELSISQSDAEELIGWIEKEMKPKIIQAKVTQRLEHHPCLVSVKDIGAVRYFIKTSLMEKSDEEKYMLMNAIMEINPTHSLIKKLVSLHKTDEDLARLLINQLFQNALVQAGLVTDTRALINDLNTLLEKAFNKI